MSDKFIPGYGVVVWLPIPIVPKARPRVTRGGKHTHMPDKYEANVESIAMLLLNPFRGQNPGWPVDKSYELFVEVMVERRNWGDVDNLLGTVMDAARGIVWLDDCQVAGAKVRKFLPADWMGHQNTARVEVRLLEPTGFEPKPPRSPTKRTGLWRRERGGAAKRATPPADARPCREPDARKGPSRGSKA